jgi:hypothetical protein
MQDHHARILRQAEAGERAHRGFSIQSRIIGISAAIIE